MTSDINGNYTNAYTYGLDRISVDNLSVANNVKTDPLYYLYDGRGSVSDVINTKGQVTDKYNYEAYGVTNHGGQLGSSDTHYENYYGYNGEDTNRLSGLQNLRARYYEPETGSFLTRDSYMGSIMEPLSLNRYTYGQNNPMMNTDPSGHWPQWLKNLGKKITKTASNLISGAKKIVSNVKSFVSKAVTKSINIVSSSKKSISKAVKNWVAPKNTSTRKQSTSTSKENAIKSQKKSTNNTAGIKNLLSMPQITTRNYANEIVRNNIVSIQYSCEGAESVGSQSYVYKEQVLKASDEKSKNYISDPRNWEYELQLGIKAKIDLIPSNMPNQKRGSLIDSIILSEAKKLQDKYSTVYNASNTIIAKYITERGLHESLDPLFKNYQTNSEKSNGYVNAFTDGLLRGVNAGIVYGAIDGATSSKSIAQNANKGGLEKTFKSVDDILENANLGRVTKGKATQWDKTGGFDKALDDFNDLGLTDIKDITGGKVGKLPDGRTVNVRTKSSDGRPTLEIFDGKKSTKIRYDK